MLRPLSERDVPPLDERLHFVDGVALAGEGERFAVRFPATGETLVALREASPRQLDAAIGAARRSFDTGVWRERTPGERAAVLEAVAARLLARQAELGARIAFDNGKTLAEAQIDVLAAAAGFRSAARYAVTGETATPATERGLVKLIAREPVGVVAGITPFNAPLPFAALKAAPALAAGNSIVLKPSERAPLVPIAVCEAAREAGLPEGVLGLVHGSAAVAAALCQDPRVDMITLTGGTPAGTAAMQAAARDIKRVLLELGGKSAHIVLADADLDAAVPAVAAGIFRNAGQRCFSGSRLVVEESVAERVEQAVAELAGALRVGDPFDPETDVGAMIDAKAASQAEAFVQRSLAEGLRLAAGGAPVSDLRPGSFFAPTVLVGGRSDSFAAQEELFGPVLTVIRVRDAEQAVAVANASRYGLAGGVWSRDVARALEVARRVRTGYFWVNTYAAILGDVPFGGYGRSGLGREGGRHGYEAYTELKTIVVDTTGGSSAPVFRRPGGR